MTITSNISTVTVSQASNTMILGVVELYGLEFTDITKYTKWSNNIDTWKVIPRWDYLEPTRGNYNSSIINLMTSIMNEANNRGVKVLLSIVNHYWPTWVPRPPETNIPRSARRFYDPTVNGYLADIWKYIARTFKNHPALKEYMILQEEACYGTYCNYWQGNGYENINKPIYDAIRSEDTLKNVDGTYKHRITLRAYVYDTQMNLDISKYGTHQFDYGTGVYPNSVTPGLSSYPSPLALRSFFKLSTYMRRDPPLIRKTVSPSKMDKFGIGEVGFPKSNSDTWTDEDALKGFKRCLAMAYQMGYKEFHIWGGNNVNKTWNFVDPVTYGPRLKAYRDLVVQSITPITKFNVRVLIDVDDNKLSYFPDSYDPNSDPYKYYLHLFKRLDNERYSWFLVNEDNTDGLYPTSIYDRTIRTSEMKNKTTTEMDTIINARLSGISPNGARYDWNTGDVTF